MGLEFKTVLSGLALLAATSANAGVGGGADGGGGNGVRSTPEQVEAFVNDKLQLTLGALLNTIQFALKPGHFPVTDNRASNLLAKIDQLIGPDKGDKHSSRSGFAHHNVKFDKRKTGACHHGKEERDASLLSVSNGGVPKEVSICLSMERLSRYPIEALGSQITALVIHELAHAAGLDETDAEYVQNYVLKKLSSNCSMVIVTDDPKGKRVYFYVKYDVVEAEIRTARFPYDKDTKDRVGNMYSLQTVTNNFAEYFSLTRSPQGNGTLKFSSMNSDVTFSPQVIEFDRPYRHGGPIEYFGSIVSSRMSFNGVPLNPIDITFTEACLR
jgi:hypothetical protein